MPDVRLPDGTVIKNVPDGITQEDLLARVGSMRQPDRKTGAPAYVRAVVGTAPQQDRLANLQRYYPDASPEGADNFTFTDPKTKQRTLYNPPGLDVGDLASVGREASQFVGSVGGGFAGAAAAAPTGLMAAPVSVPVGAALGSQAAGESYDLLMKALTGMKDTRSVPQRVMETAGATGVEAVMGKVGAEIPGAFRGAVNMVRNRMAGAPTSQVAQEFTAIGAKPSAGTVTGDRMLQRVENAVAQSAGGTGVMQRHDEALIDALGKEAEGLAQKFGPVQNKEGLGVVLRDASKGAIQRFSDRSEKLFDVAAKAMPSNIETPMENTLRFAQEFKNNSLSQKFPNVAGSVQNPKVSGIVNDLLTDVENLFQSANKGYGAAPGQGVASNPGATYQELKAIRSRVGKILGDPMGYPDFDRAQLKGLYGALSQDLDAIATKAGGDALKAHQTASRYFRYNLGKNVEFVNELADKKWDEQVYNLAMSGTRDGGSKLRTLRRNFIYKDPDTGEVKSDAWDTLAGSVLYKMGLAKPGVQSADGNLFSPGTFLTNWNSMDDAARKQLFGGTRYEQLAPQLDRLTRLTAAVKDTSATRNYSNTAGALHFLTLLGAGAGAVGGMFSENGSGTGGALAGATAAIVAPRAVAKLMTSPKFVNWLGTTVKVANTNYNNVPAQIGRLISIAKAEPELREEIYQYVSALREAPAPNEAQKQGQPK
jgi:hypothetical protein